MGRRTRHGLVAAVLTSLLAAAGLVTASAPAEAAATVTFTGRGYGHGRGLSQHGAQARAKAGQTAEQILAAYYPGTGRQTVSDGQAIEVWITGDTDNEMWFRPEAGMTLTTASGTVALPSMVPTGSGAATPTLWRIRLVSLTFVLEGQVGTAWYRVTDAALNAPLQNVTKATITAPDGTVQLVTGTRYREYRGTLSANRVGNGSPAPLRTTVSTDLASYLASVVPSEMPASWEAEALKAQAVAARTYALFDKANGGPAWYDTCDSTQCQVFSGVADYDAAGRRVTLHEDSRTTSAVTATSGLVVWHNGGPAFTQFSSSNGGYSLEGSQPYLVAAADPYDTYSWTLAVPVTTIQSAYPAIGTFRGFSVTRDGRGAYGGRTVTVTIQGSAGSTTVSGDAFRSALGLRSTMWTAKLDFPPVVAPQRDWNGGGPDIVARAPNGRLHLYAGKSGATWASAAQIGKGWGEMRLLTQVYGFDSSPKPALVAVHTSGRLYLYPGTGTGGFGTPRQIGRGWAGFDVLVGTHGWHQAGKPGFIVRRTSGELLYYPATGAGGWGTQRSLGTGFGVYDLMTFGGDWDMDGRPDLIARETATGRLYQIPGDGKGGLRARVQIGRGWSGMDAIVGGADYDRDGCYDVLSRDTQGRLWLYPGDCMGGFGASRQVGKGWTGYTIIH